MNRLNLVKKGQRTKIVFFLMGMIVFSSLSSIITMGMLGLPVALPELLFFLFYIVFRKIININFYLTKKLLILILIWGLLIPVGVFFEDDMRFYDILSTARPYFYLIISYCIFSQVEEVNYENVYYTCLGSLLGWLIFAGYVFTFHSIIFTDEVFAVYGNMIALSILVACSILLKPRTILPILMCVVAVFIFSATRRVFVVAAASLLVSLIFYIRRDKAKAIILCSALIAVGAYFSTDVYKGVDYLSDVAPLVKYRTIGKIENIYYSLSLDTGRIEIFGLLFNNMNDFLIPKGFVSKQINRDPALGRYNDFPLMEIVYTLSILGALLILFYFLLKLYKVLVREIKKPSTEKEVVIVATLICFMLLFLEGTYISYAYITPFTGFVLGRLNYLSRSSRVLKMGGVNTIGFN